MFRFARRLLAILVLAGCRSSAPASRALGEHDDFGTPIQAGDPARRIASLNPTTTELLFAIGASAKVAGRSMYDTFPAPAKTVRDLGPALRPNVEAILGVHPDLVLLYASQDNRPAYDRLRASGIRTLAFKVDSIEQFRRVTLLLGRLTGDSAPARQAVDSVSATLARIRTATEGLQHPTVFMHAWDKPIIAIGGGSFMSELLSIAGARNVYADLAAPSGTVTLEDVVRRNPDFVLASSETAARMRSSAEWRTLPAVRDNHFIIYDPDLLARPSIQLGAAAHALADAIHPGAVR